MNLQAKYPVSMRVLHWLISLLILTLIGVGWYMAELPKEDPNKYALYPWHKSFGMLVLMLVSLRLVNRLRSQVPPMPSVLASWELGLAKVTHCVLYLFMFAVPLSGYTMSSAGGYDINFFGTTLPALIAKNETIGGIAHEAHEILGFALLGLVALHAAGAIKHRLFDKDKGGDVLGRML